MLLVRLPYSTRQGDGIGCLGVRYYRLITIYYGLARAAPHRVPLQGYGRNYHKRAWRCGQALHTLPGWIYSPRKLERMKVAMRTRTTKIIAKKELTVFISGT